jgi:hypothetical protein
MSKRPKTSIVINLFAGSSRVSCKTTVTELQERLAMDLCQITGSGNKNEKNVVGWVKKLL